MNKVFRNEEKYLVSEGEMIILQSKMNSILKVDPNQKGDRYRIRSVYFDDYFDQAYQENDAGVDERKKIRIRVYDEPRKYIRLEVKHKIKGKNLKENCRLTEEQFQSIMNGTLRYDDDFPQALRILFLEMKLNHLVPKVIVEYERSTYVHDIGNVRITFDRNISYSTEFNKFLDDTISLTPLLPSGSHIFEVKYDGFLPEIIAQTIETGELQKETFSKYYLSRLALEGDYYE